MGTSQCMAGTMEGCTDVNSEGQEDSDDGGDNLHNDENEETVSWCGSFKSCQSRLGSECSYYSFDEDEDDKDPDYRALDEDALEMDKSDSQHSVDKQNSESNIHTLVLSTEDVRVGVCSITKKETEEENLGDEVLPLSFYDSEEDITNYNIEHEHNGFCVAAWIDSNSLSSSGSSLAERSLDSDGSCRTATKTARRGPLLIRRNTVSLTNRKPWNYAAGSPRGTKKLSLG